VGPGYRGGASAANLPPEQKAEALMRIAVTTTAAKLMPQYEASQGQSVWSADRSTRSARATAIPCCPWPGGITPWAPNIAVKLPATSAGLDVMEECVAEGITVAMTISFTVPAGHRDRGAAHGRHGARPRQSIEPGKCFAVIMIGRLDDSAEVGPRHRAAATESDIRILLALSNAPIESIEEPRLQSRAAGRGIARRLPPDRVGRAGLLMSIAPAIQGSLLPKTCRRRNA